MGRYVNYWGLVIAGIGFFLTRFTVTLALYEDPVRFVLAGVVPLALGLGVAAFGVALAVAEVEASLVRTTAVWCVLGTSGMLVLAVLTLLGSVDETTGYLAAVRSRAYLSNFLIGGSVGGTLTGLYAARNRHQRERLRQQASRLEILNRLLRHEVLNALTVIRGYAATGDTPGQDAATAIEQHADAIEHTIEDVKYLTRSTGTDGASLRSIDVREAVERSVQTVRERYPGADISVVHEADDATARADGRLSHAVAHLVENAVVHAGVDEPEVELTVTRSDGRVRIAVRDEGPGLPPSQRALLETGEIEPFDDPGTGFGLNIVRLLVESYGGAVETTVDEDGSTVTIVLRRPDAAEATLRTGRPGGAGVRPAASNLAVILGAAMVAGVAYGVVAELLGGSVAFIGVYYGVKDPLVGWLTHEFHSAVFAFVFAGLVSLAPARYRNDVAAFVGIGVCWGVVLWLGAAGLISPIWLRLLGIPAPIPSISPMLLATHLAWGITLGALTAWGYEHVSPRLATLWSRLEGRRAD